MVHAAERISINMKSALDFIELLKQSPIIAAVKNGEELERALQSDSNIVFLLYGSIMDIAQLTQRITECGKLPFVHVDLIDGLSIRRDVAVDFIHKQTNAVGVISTHQSVIRYAKSLGMITVQRFFLLDSLAFQNVIRQSSDADAVDILPGAMPKVIRKLSQKMHRPIIASGLITDKDDIISALSAGALAISTTDAALWFV